MLGLGLHSHSLHPFCPEIYDYHHLTDKKDRSKGNYHLDLSHFTSLRDPSQVSPHPHKKI